MFVNEGYENYKYLIEISDNYIVLSNEAYANGTWDNPDRIDVIYQYVKPSTLTVESELVYTTEKDFIRIEQSNNYWDRGDACEITIATFSVIWFILFVINALTRFVKKGGVFFGQ